MAKNKIIYGNETLIDLTSDTVSSDKMTLGTFAHDKSGNIIEGSLVIQRYYVGSTEPASSFGNNGDLYLKV